MSEKTLECVAQLVEQVLEGKKNPLPKQLGRKTDPHTMWLCFHMVGVVPYRLSGLRRSDLQHDR